MSRLKQTLLASAVFLGLGSLAMAQAAPTYDPAQLPAVKGKVAQYLLSPHGGVDGLLLEDGTEVHIRAMLGSELAFAVRPGDTVTIHGLKAKATPMVAAASITNDATGVTVAARMGRGRHDAAETLETSGVIKATLHEPRGAIDGVLLDNGAVVRMPPPEAKKFAAQLAIGQKLFARGSGSASPLGTIILARQIGADPTSLSEVARPHWAGHRGMMGRGAGEE